VNWCGEEGTAAERRMYVHGKHEIRKILFVRRDNIGDLICTTPAISSARKAFPRARIGILVNTYNADAVMNNPDIDETYVYEKAKHSPDKNRLLVWWRNFGVLRKIRAERYDVAIGCGSYSPRLARYTFATGADMRIGYVESSANKKAYNFPLVEERGNLHEVERTFRLLAPLGIEGLPPLLKIFPLPEEVRKVRESLDESVVRKGSPTVALHISSRRPENRWPERSFIELARLIVDRRRSNLLLLWSPGTETNVRHSGDDEKAQRIMRGMEAWISPYRTVQLRELVAALSICDVVVCGDGGAMHIAAALGKPVVTVWGSTRQDRWRPWGVNHIVLQDSGGKAESIDATRVFYAIEKLLSEMLL
jgi:heptosyltransferase-3